MPSSSSSSSKPSGSSSSSSGSSGSSSSSSVPKPSSPQPYPHITANAWMSFFLFCCLVLIILQGPLGLTGGGVFPGVSQWTQWPSLGGGLWNGLAGAPGCVGVVSGVVPWCQQQQPAPMQAVAQPQVQVQQVIQNAAPPQYPPAAPRVVTYNGGGGVPAQMGGQGGFATPEGGGGWSWYANGPSPARAARQEYIYPQAQRYPRSRTVQYQRPGLQIQVSDGQPQPATPYYSYSYPQQNYVANGQIFTTTSNAYQCTIWQPWYCAPIYAYAYGYVPLQQPQYVQYAAAGAAQYQHQYQHQPPAHYQYAPSYGNYGNAIIREPRGNGYNLMYQQAGGNVHYQTPGVRPVAPPVQPVAVAAPPSAMSPSPLGGLANLENAFYPLLVGAIALLVIFDYTS
nr:hypothetical protein L204_03893 [Cryptococcus depauperatus CBS 7855]